MRVPLLLLTLMLVCTSVSAREYHLCVDSNDWGTYTHPDHDGSLQTLVRAAAARQGDSVRFTAVPWLRCKAMAASGEVDGLLGTPATPEAREHFAFPLAAGDADSGRSLATVQIVLVRRADCPVAWDGKTLSGLKGKVAHVQGYNAIGALLDELNIPQSGDYRSDRQNMQALLAGRLDVIATYAESAKTLLAIDEYKGKIVQIDPPLGQIVYYVAFTRPLYSAEPERIERLWQAIGDLRKD